MAPIVPDVIGLGLYANLGGTNKFFMPWLNPRNGRTSVFEGSWLSRLFGRRRRRSSRNNLEAEEFEHGNKIFLSVRKYVTKNGDKI